MFRFSKVSACLVLSAVACLSFSCKKQETDQSETNRVLRECKLSKNYSLRRSSGDRFLKPIEDLAKSRGVHIELTSTNNNFLSVYTVSVNGNCDGVDAVMKFVEQSFAGLDRVRVCENTKFYSVHEPVSDNILANIDSAAKDKGVHLKISVDRRLKTTEYTFAAEGECNSFDEIMDMIAHAFAKLK